MNYYQLTVSHLDGDSDLSSSSSSSSPKLSVRRNVSEESRKTAPQSEPRKLEEWEHDKKTGKDDILVREKVAAEGSDGEMQQKVKDEAEDEDEDDPNWFVSTRKWEKSKKSVDVPPKDPSSSARAERNTSCAQEKNNGVVLRREKIERNETRRVSNINRFSKLIQGIAFRDANDTEVEKSSPSGEKTAVRGNGGADECRTDARKRYDENEDLLLGLPHDDLQLGFPQAEFSVQKDFQPPGPPLCSPLGEAEASSATSSFQVEDPVAARICELFDEMQPLAWQDQLEFSGDPLRGSALQHQKGRNFLRSGSKVKYARTRPRIFFCTLSFE